MAKNSQSGIEYFALGFVAGLAVGAAVALLGTPKSGRLMRRDLKRGLEDVSEVVRDHLDDQIRELTDNMREVEQASKDVAGGIRAKMD